MGAISNYLASVDPTDVQAYWEAIFLGGDELA